MCQWWTCRQLRAAAVLVLLYLTAAQLVDAQSQDTINATLAEQMHMNAIRLDRLESQQDKTEVKVDKINWILGVLSAQLIMELIKLWHSRSGNNAEHPPRIYERRSFDRED